MSLRVIIVRIINLIVVEVEGIAIVVATLTTRRGLELWLMKGRSSIIFSSLAVWKKSQMLAVNSYAIHEHSCCCRRHLIAFRIIKSILTKSSDDFE